MKLNNFKKTMLTFTMVSIFTANAIPTYGALGDTTLEYKMENEDIEVLQKELEEFGYLSLDGKYTTYYGEVTLEGVKALQEDKGLEANGVYEENTHSALLKLKEEKYEKYKLVYNEDLSLESENDDVNALQRALKELGFLDIDDCTNYFGSITDNALISFQRAVGITPDGIAGIRTVQMINKALAGEDVFLEDANRGGERGSLGQNIIDTGKKYLGTPYVYAASSPRGFDCSGFTQFVYKQHGINISRSSRTQANDGKLISRADLQRGDLIIFSGTTRSGGISHVGIYVGDGQFIHASSFGSGVKFDNLNSNYYSPRFHSARRVF